MQPQDTNQQPATPTPGQFDFMLKNQPKPPNRFSVLLSGIPKPAKVALLIIGIVFILVILYSLLVGGKTAGTDQLTLVMARAQEIARISALAGQQAKNPDTKGLAATTEAILNSQARELQTYLTDLKVKVNVKKIAVLYLDKKADAKLATALQNNNYDQTYFDYLKTNLATYKNQLLVTYKGVGKNVQTILNSDYKSVETILSAPQLK
ncbi:hypothetical protein HYW36_02355 [Candidatus Saccharibacteria bacterium]|nr:hypothetical protein [Candidatus Saccharibacteria bacterium]